MNAVLGTAQFCILLSNGSKSRNIRALCDTGSQLNLITENCVQQLGLIRTKQKTSIMGIGSTLCSNGFVDITITHRATVAASVTARFFIMSKISSNSPDHRFANPFIESLSVDQLADPEFNQPGTIDALIGVGIWSEIVVTEIQRVGSDQESFLAQNTALGWIICGQFSARISGQTNRCFVVVDNAQLDASIRKFWEVENLPTRRTWTADEQLAESIFINTHRRDSSGRYIVRIPRKPNPPTLGNSHNLAIGCFRSLERKFAKDPDLYQKYRGVIDDYRSNGHFTLSTTEPANDCDQYFIPHHPINADPLRPSKGKFRVVFNASATTTSGASFNDQQLTGPKLQSDLCELFLRFRWNEFALSADIIQMYRQVRVDKRDWDFQKIIWRDTPQQRLLHLQCTVITWGTASASFNAVRALRQCAIDEKTDFPLGSEITLRDFYMDDLLTNAATEQQLEEGYKQTAGLLARGGFQLGKLVSNSPRMAAYTEQAAGDEVSFPEESGVLGMRWLPQTDEIHLKVLKSPVIAGKITKRMAISKISQAFDPSGILAPVLLMGKILIQSIWASGIDWDQELTPPLLTSWHEYCNNIQMIDTIHWPRWIGANSASSVELHVFADASEKAFGAVAYIKTMRMDGKETKNIIAAKSRVAPIKMITIPRLELMAAKMAAELAEYVKAACSLMDVPTHFWTDSAIVVFWLKRDPALNKVFVANKVTTILQLSNGAPWRHIAGATNPADLVSRGASVEQLTQSSLWWHGPSWLALPAHQWPQATVACLSTKELDTVSCETKAKIVAITQVHKLNGLSITIANGPPEPIIHRRSTLNSALRVTAFVYRFIDRIKACAALKQRFKAKRMAITKMATQSNKPSPVTPAELNRALLYWVKVTQQTYYGKELAACLHSNPLPRNSTLLRLLPFADAQGILRVGGRLNYADISDDTKHQLIIPPESRLAVLLIGNAHHITMHGGPQLMMTHLRKRFWMNKMRQTVRKNIYSCVICTRFRHQPAEQRMADLPAFRVNVAEPFAKTGLDFAGPFEIRRAPGRPPSIRLASNRKDTTATTTTLKAWIVIFTCLASRAVHIDVVVSLKMEEFLAAFSRFVSRKGRCLELISDNATTFIGACNELIRVLTEWEKNIPAAEMAKFRTTWKFITPSAPHQGGAWEAMVKRTKYHLKRAIGTRILTRDELYTIATEIEGIINSRPLWTPSDDSADPSPITPAHLIIGKPILSQPLTEACLDVPDNRLTAWARQQKIHHHFWTRWQQEYVTNLQSRTKWHSEKENVKTDDIVLVIDDNAPPAHWTIGRIIGVTKASDGLVRSVKIRTPTTTLDRPIQKICVLPTTDSSNL